MPPGNVNSGIAGILVPTGPRGKHRMILEPVTIAAGVRLIKLKLPKLARCPAIGQWSTERFPFRDLSWASATFAITAIGVPPALAAGPQAMRK